MELSPEFNPPSVGPTKNPVQPLCAPLYIKHPEQPLMYLQQMYFKPGTNTLDWRYQDPKSWRYAIYTSEELGQQILMGYRCNAEDRERVRHELLKQEEELLYIKFFPAIKDDPTVTAIGFSFDQTEIEREIFRENAGLTFVNNHKFGPCCSAPYHKMRLPELPWMTTEENLDKLAPEHKNTISIIRQPSVAPLCLVGSNKPQPALPLALPAALPSLDQLLDKQHTNRQRLLLPFYTPLFIREANGNPYYLDEIRLLPDTMDVGYLFHNPIDQIDACYSDHELLRIMHRNNPVSTQRIHAPYMDAQIHLLQPLCREMDKSRAGGKPHMTCGYFFDRNQMMNYFYDHAGDTPRLYGENFGLHLDWPQEPHTICLPVEPWAQAPDGNLVLPATKRNIIQLL